MNDRQHTTTLFLPCALALAMTACLTPEATTIPDTASWQTVTAAPAPPPPPKPAPPAPQDPDKPFVVVHYGDSHSSVPAMPAKLRDLIAQGATTSPGFVAPEHAMPGAKVNKKGPWKKHNWIYGHDKGPFGPMGLAWSVRRAEARMILALSRDTTPTRGVKVTALYAKQPGHPAFELRSGGDLLARAEPPEDDAEPLRLGTLEVDLPEGQTDLELKVIGHKGDGAEMRFYGFLVQFEGAAVEYDAFGVIGATIRSPARRFDQSARDYLAMRDPSVVVVWYGSNSAYRKNLDMRQYKAQYLEMLQNFRKNAPGAVCVAVGPPDLGRTGGACEAGGRFALPGTYSPPAQRRTNTAPRRGGKIDNQGRVLRRRPNARKRRPTRRGRTRTRIKRMGEGADVPLGAGPECEGQGPIPQIVKVQREAAFEAGCAYFDTYAWMGGPGSMARWARHKPRLGAGDLVHLTFAGYKVVAHGIHESLPRLRQAPALPEPPERASAESPLCPAGADHDAAHNLCALGEEALGPFTKTMVARCESQGGAACGGPRWPLEIARKIRGKHACPPGARPDRALGYCVDARFAYGPFEGQHIDHCRQIGGGAACNTLRWPRAITPARRVSMLATAPQAPTNGFVPRTGSCQVKEVELPMSWRQCADHMDCVEATDPETGRRRRLLQTPSRGPVAMEAHLVTDEDGFGGGWPSSSRDGLKAHHARAQAISGYVMRRTQVWAPAGEGGCEYGQGSAPGKVPVQAETWYINMFWKKRPPRGTRMIVTNPRNGRSVVAAAGYETGPGSHEVMAGVSEEIHHYLGTRHRSNLIVGFAEDQTQPFGPIDCQ